MRIVVLVILVATSFARASDPVTLAELIKELADPYAIARLPDPPFRLIQSSSYDPASKTPDDAKTWFANDDSGKFIRVDDRDGRRESVMLDVEGPGAVVRVWSPNPKGVMRVYIDGNAKPIIEAPMEAVLDGTAFFGDEKHGFPLAGSRSRGWNLFIPIPFAKRCLITTDDGVGLRHRSVRRQRQGRGNADRSLQRRKRKSVAVRTDRSRYADRERRRHHASRHGRRRQRARRGNAGVLRARCGRGDALTTVDAPIAHTAASTSAVAAPPSASTRPGGPAGCDHCPATRSIVACRLRRHLGRRYFQGPDRRTRRLRRDPRT